MARQSTSRGLYLAYRIFSTMTDNTDTYNFVGYTDSETLPGHQKISSEEEYMNQFTDIRILTNEL